MRPESITPPALRCGLRVLVRHPAVDDGDIEFIGQLQLRLLPPDLTGWELWHVSMPDRVGSMRRYVSPKDQLVKLPSGEEVSFAQSLELLNAEHGKAGA